MSDMIEAVARAMADRLDLDWDGKANGTEYANHGYWLPLAQAAITAHTAALIAGAGELGELLEAWGDQDKGYGYDARGNAMHQAAATIAALEARAEAAEAECLEQDRLVGMSGERELALRAELATARLEGVRLGIEAAAGAFEIPDNKVGDFDNCCIDALYVQECAIRALDAAAIAKGER